MNPNQLWQSVLNEIELQVSKANFATWLKDSRLVEKEEGTALISLPSNFAKEWVENKYSKVILAALRNLDGTTKKVEYIVESQQETAAKLKMKRVDATNKRFISSEQLSFSEWKIDPETNLNPRYSLSSFVVGSSNEFAYAAVTAVIKEIGRKYNPLFLFGGVGVGKTHLIQGLGNEIKNLYENRVKVKYISSEKFISEVVAGIRNKRMEDFKERYRSVDVLIVDDIQSIGGKPTTEEEFFNTFNALYENNKQIIISSDRPPRFLPTLHERLRSRFEGGMTSELYSPDYELRVAVLKTKLQEKNCSLPENVIDLIANKAQRNFRELEGVLNRILFYQNTKNYNISIEVTEEIINEMLQQPIKNVNPNQIIKGVADHFEITINDLIGPSRKKNLVVPRQIAIYLLRDVLKMSYPSIGEKLGNRDHTTALYSFNKLAKEIPKNQDLNHQILSIKDEVFKS